MSSLINKIYAYLFTVFVLYIIVGCTSSVDTDARNLADLQCRSRRTAEKVARGDQSLAIQSTKLILELTELRSTLDVKYPPGSSREEFTKAYEKALQECR